MSARVELLTDADRDILAPFAWSVWSQRQPETLFNHVESIVAARVAEAWDEGWNAHARGQVTEARFDPYQWNKNPYRADA